MNKTGSAAKVKLNSFDDLFGDGQPQAGIEQVQEIALSELHEFKGHPFKVLDDEKMQETVESVREHGVLMPGIARPRAEGGYEIIAGHRRRHACELVGLDTMPMFIRNYTDDEATIIMVDSNIQREDILPSEKAKAYRMKYEAMKHQGSRAGGLTLDELGGAAGESAKTVQRYIWISRLSEPLLDMVDSGKIGIMQAVDISFLSEDAQQWVLVAIQDTNAVITKQQSAMLKESDKKGELTFPKKGVRFIAVNNGVDSANPTDNDFTPFLNIMNEWYAKDTSKKIKAVFKARMRDGKRVSGAVPYGYYRKPEDKQTLYVDEVSASVVRRIFQFACEGMGATAIADTLSADKVLIPSAYARQNHPEDCQCTRYHDAYTWNATTVGYILSRREYLGHTILGKTTKDSFKTKRKRVLPKMQLCRLLMNLE